MKTTSLITALLIGSLAVSAGPAFAKTSLQKGEKLCKAAVEAAEPGVQNVRATDDETTINESTLTYFLKVKKADNAQVKMTCKVDRATDKATLAPVS